MKFNYITLDRDDNANLETIASKGRSYEDIVVRLYKYLLGTLDRGLSDNNPEGTMSFIYQNIGLEALCDMIMLIAQPLDVWTMKVHDNITSIVNTNHDNSILNVADSGIKIKLSNMPTMIVS